MTSRVQIDASPTKQFFVRMLTRDIELHEAILDLLDNCVDGIVRSLKAKSKRGGIISNPSRLKPYNGYYAHITATANEFVIEDNCGGIPRDIAEKVAFRLGRPSNAELQRLGIDLENEGTVGVYGIGMKRAIFKMGADAIVSSQHNSDAFQVKINPEWLDSESWQLDLQNIKRCKVAGTRIEVFQLYPDIARQFSSDSNFLENLHDAIAQLFAVIIGKGFLVKLNDSEIKPVTLNLLYPQTKTDQSDISPYVFQGNVKGVEVEVVVGFYRDPTAQSELDDDEENRASIVRQAGWSVVCNDRLIVYGDKSEMTGWGTKPVPRFHGQYNSIAGVVTLRSVDPELLPLNTKKRGIDASMGIYFKVLDYMKDGIKLFIDYTNKWKGRLAETALQFKGAKQVPASEIPKIVPSEGYTQVTQKRLADPTGQAREYKPELPHPPVDAKTRRIQFSKPIDEIREIAISLLDDEKAQPSAVGQTCFERVLNSIRKAKRTS